MDGLSDNSLLVALERGERWAYEEVFKRYWLKVRRFLTVVTGDKTVSEDLAQNIFMKLWLHRGTLSGVISLDSYLYAMSRNEAYDWFRRTSSRRKYENEEALMEEFLCNMKLDHDMEVIENTVDKCIRSMPPQRRLCYEMSRKEHLTAEKIASRLNLSRRTVEHHISLGIKDIRNSLGKILN
ncbi:MAG: sigma-70 family RNA polymerase sigma factor [Bacteroidales bacterium]|nr:sigma-70 family RNA polymerase sigma factor [Bacteroidales bacterium]